MMMGFSFFLQHEIVVMQQFLVRLFWCGIVPFAAIRMIFLCRVLGMRGRVAKLDCVDGLLFA